MPTWGWCSDDIFLLDRLPTRLLVVGGGFIACEMAGIMAGLGVRVTQFYRGAQILRGFDDEARGLVAEGLRAQRHRPALRHRSGGDGARKRAA